MKTTRHILLFIVALITFSNINAHKSKIDSLSITFDCAIFDHSISVADISVTALKNCKRLVITGTGHEEFKIVAAKVSILSNKHLKEFNIKNGNFGEELTLAISNQTPGAKIYIEQVKIQSIKEPTIIKNLKTVCLIVK